MINLWKTCNMTEKFFNPKKYYIDYFYIKDIFYYFKNLIQLYSQKK